MLVTIKWLASIPSPYNECAQVPDPSSGTPWQTSALGDGAHPKCIKIDGFAIPKHGKANIDVNYEFRLKGTNNWANTGSMTPQQLFRAGFAFKSTTQITLDPDFVVPSLAGKTYVGNQAVGLVGAGQQVTAVGGFLFDTNGTGVAGATIRLFDTMPSGNACAATGARAETTSASDGFYFIWRAGTDQNSSTAINLASGYKFYEAICGLSFAPAYWPARYIDHKLANKEFDEEDFYISAPSSIAITAQPLSGRVNRTLGTFQVSVLDAFHNVVTTDNGTSITLSTSPAALAGTYPRTVTGGVANFTDLKFTAIGDYTLTFTTTSPWGTSSDTTLSIHITP
jgi:hypothetical protein